jgi:hypothetical protein
MSFGPTRLAVMKAKGFGGCIGFVDGITICLFQQPAIDGQVFWDCKKQYSINCQIVSSHAL